MLSDVHEHCDSSIKRLSIVDCVVKTTLEIDNRVERFDVTSLYQHLSDQVFARIGQPVGAEGARPSERVDREI
ncbi:hypothetical protein [Paraburkholderia phymatum]|uniref:hypothetical protein n=1 Tax=Paraburkholderia phymatum TaxID=148447 RepID=UPI0002E31C09|nr:hypothetical protein [Paraburkholderia phymatum]